MTLPWLTILGLLPIIGGLALFLPMKGASRYLGMFFALLTAGIGGAIVALYNAGADLTVQAPWIRSIGAYWALGADGMGLAMVILTIVLTPLVLLAEWKLPLEGAKWSPQAFVALVLILEGLSIFVFTANDILLFYLFFEATLIPMYFLIIGFGGPRRGYAAIKFLLFSLAGGLVMLASVIGLYGVSASQGTPSYLLSDLQKINFDGDLGRWLMLGFLFAFAVKAPMVPVHTWLPDAAEQSTPGTATMLVGILDKIGTFGMIKFCLGIFPEASRWAAPVMMVLAVVSILWGALGAITSKNLMRLVAYTSVSHFGFMVLGIYALTTQSIAGTAFYMLNHGFSTAALFLVVGFVIKRRGDASISSFGGVQKLVPLMSGVFLLAWLSALGLPGISTFVSEFMVLAGAFGRNPWFAGVAALGVILSSVYALRVYRVVMTGPVTDDTAAHFTGRELTGVEKFVMAPILGYLLFFGFYPQPVVHLVESTAVTAMQRVQVSDPAPVVEGVK